MTEKRGQFIINGGRKNNETESMEYPAYALHGDGVYTPPMWRLRGKTQ